MFGNFITVAILAALPISEVRGAIPVAYLVFNWSIWLSFGVAVGANILSGVLIFKILPSIFDILRTRLLFTENILSKVTQSILRKHAPKFETRSLWALYILVALPLPFTGVWTGVLTAYLLNLPKKGVILALVGGTITAGFLVSLVVLLGSQAPALLSQWLIVKIK